LRRGPSAKDPKGSVKLGSAGGKRGGTNFRTAAKKKGKGFGEKEFLHTSVTALWDRKKGKRSKKKTKPPKGHHSRRENSLPP